MHVRHLLCAIVISALTVRPAPALAQMRLVGDPLRDVEHTIRARRLLDIDPELAGQNIGVIVHDRVATLWGPAPSAQIAFRAELCLRGMIELVEIRNGIFVSDFFDPLRPPAKFVRSAPGSSQYTPLSPREPRAMLEAPTPITDGVNAALLIKELPPLPLPSADAEPIEREANIERDQRLTEAVRATLSGSAFPGVLYSVKEGRISLRTTTGNTAVLHQAAQAVALLPHVTGVLVVDKATSR